MADRSTLLTGGAPTQGVNVGSGEGVFRDKCNDITLVYKSLASADDNTLTISADTTTIYFSANTGGGGIGEHSLSAHTDVEYVYYSGVSDDGSTFWEIPHQSELRYDKTINSWRNTCPYWTYVEEEKILVPSKIDVDVQLGMIHVPTDGGKLIITDMGVTTGSTENAENSYIFNIGDKDVLRIYSESDGNGGVKNASMVLDGNYFYLGDPMRDSTWRMCNDVVNGNLVYEFFDGTGWVQKSVISGGSTTNIVLEQQNEINLLKDCITEIKNFLNI